MSISSYNLAEIIRGKRNVYNNDFVHHVMYRFNNAGLCTKKMPFAAGNIEKKSCGMGKSNEHPVGIYLRDTFFTSHSSGERITIYIISSQRGDLD